MTIVRMFHVMDLVDKEGSRVRFWWERFHRRREGQALVEYVLIIALVVVAAVTVLKLVGTNIATTLNNIAQNL
jgi:Flp pilus assembly pilin Flp